MTIVKQKAVATESYASSLERYIDGKDAVMRDGWNLSLDGDWFREMAIVRYAAGHDVPSKVGMRNTILFHQVLAFLPEEADVNGGPMTPEKCMEYARDYIRRRYSDQQVALALHEEVSPADGTHRYAVHLVINRTDLKTGRRVDEGRSRNAKVSRANTIRDLDREWGLAEVVAGAANSRIHERQLDTDAKAIEARGGVSYKNSLRLWCEHLAGKVESMGQLIAGLEGHGFKCEIRGNGRLYVTDPDRVIVEPGVVRQRREGTAPPTYWFDIAKMTSKFSLASLESCFFENALTGLISDEMQEEVAAEIERTELIDGYRAAAKRAWRAYIAKVKPLAGQPLDKVPSFRLPSCPEQIRKEHEVRSLMADYRMKAARVRYKIADMTAFAGSASAGADGDPRLPNDPGLDAPAAERHRDGNRSR